MTINALWRDRAIIREAGASFEAEWYVRFGRRQRLPDWLQQHTSAEAGEMFASTAVLEGVHLRILELFPIVEPVKLTAVRVFFPADLCEDDVEDLRGFLDHQAEKKGLQVEAETVTLQVRVDSSTGIWLGFSGLAR